MLYCSLSLALSLSSLVVVIASIYVFDGRGYINSLRLAYGRLVVPSLMPRSADGIISMFVSWLVFCHVVLMARPAISVPSHSLP